MHFGTTMWFTEYSMSLSEIAVHSKSAALNLYGHRSIRTSRCQEMPGTGMLRKEQADADRAAREAQGLLVTALACVRRWRRPPQQILQIGIGGGETRSPHYAFRACCDL
jgi:hypothetical protein